MKEIIKQLVIDSLKEEASFVVEHPADISKGDYSTNVALVLAKKLKQNPVDFAQSLVVEIQKTLPDTISKVEVAGPGFINFFLSEKFFVESIKEILNNKNEFGKVDGEFTGKKLAIEYTDPNPFKQFHIGHLMTNIIGEALARLAEWNSAEVKRFCYQGDVGRHVALTIWGLRFMETPFPEETDSLSEKVKFLGTAYALGSKKIAETPEKESEVQTINKKVYDRSDAEVNEVYDKGREWSLEHFEEIYKILGTKFDQYFFESMSAPVGVEIVKENTPKIFQESDGAIIFKGEEYGLHTRVFITKEGLPTYEGKELGLAKLKYQSYPFDKGIVITANEQNDYFTVILKALSLIYPEIASKSSHISHGMFRTPEGKMSSRTGKVITGESLLQDMIETSFEKVKDRPLEDSEKKKISEQVAVGAIKYSILKQSIGKDIVFDKEKALSFEGDSGPYLQYAHTRAISVLRKAKEEGIDIDVEAKSGNSENSLSKILYRFPEIIEEAFVLKAPQLVVTYLTELASAFNGYYANNVIIDKANPQESSARLAVVACFATVMKNGLTVLGIPVPEKM